MTMDAFRTLNLEQVARGWTTPAATEHDYWIVPSDIDGNVPSDCIGTIFRNGPGVFSNSL
jgi:all-trans-8'-apo-beta-carotenal 15,15'-oxygenase